MKKLLNIFVTLKKDILLVNKCLNLLTKQVRKLRTHKIVEETRQFYKQLYKNKIVKEVNIDEFITNTPKLDEEKSDTLEGRIRLEEASKALKNMKNGKSPGTDGMTVDFFKFFWKDIGHFVIRSLNEGFEIGKMSITQREGMIICIPKGDKPREFLKNWRPISLLNVVYKIGSACIANRIKTILPELINEDQTGFVPGRYIGDNLRLLYDMIHYLQNENLPGLLLPSHTLLVLSWLSFRPEILPKSSKCLNNFSYDCLSPSKRSVVSSAN